MKRLSPSMVVSLLALFLALGSGAFAAVRTLPGGVVFKGCVNDKTGVLRVVIKGGCHERREVAISWNERGVPGRRGPSGLRGVAGPKGATGLQGPTGLQGLTGTVDTANFYTKGQSDGLFLPVGGEAVNAAALDGLQAGAFESSSLFAGSRPVSVETTVSGAHESCYVGELRLFAGNFAPSGTVFADGQLLKINQNTALFSILGTLYGGNGVTTFALPDLHDLGPGGTSYVICLEGIFPARNE